uniref:Paired domain-containing protein n=1 Tax=Caenorhabditis japonica TaxID=281687 RepID=A0A8R1EV00_CAEJA
MGSIKQMGCRYHIIPSFIVDIRVPPQRAIIAKLYAEGHQAWDIVRRLDIPRTTVYKVINQLKMTGNVDETWNSRRPRTVNTRRTRGIIRKRYWSQLEQGGITFRNRCAACRTLVSLLKSYFLF